MADSIIPYGSELEKGVFFLFHQRSRIRPKYITAPAMFPFAGNFVSAKSTISGSVLKMHAHWGRPVYQFAVIDVFLLWDSLE